MTGKCRLCLAEPCELRNSHIIPEFHYQICYDEVHRFHRLSSVDPKPNRLVQKGYREYLLCQTCETKLSKWEGYAKRVLVDRGFQSAEKFPWGYRFTDVEYAPFKLFLMSLLWRMGVSSLEMFGLVTLGTRHEERLRQILVTEEPPEKGCYPVLMTVVTIGDKLIEDFIVPPSLVKADGQHFYRCVINGIQYLFAVGSRRLDPEMEERALGEDGVLDLVLLSSEELPYLHDHFHCIYKALNRTGPN